MPFQFTNIDDVIIGGEGHYIDGLATESCPMALKANADSEFPTSMLGYDGVGIVVKGKSNVTIKNVEVKNFCNGILLYGPSKDDTIEDCIVHDNGNPNVDAMTADIHGISLQTGLQQHRETENYEDAGATGCTDSCGAPRGDLNDDGVITPADAMIAL